MVTPLESLKEKYMKDPEIIPEKGQSKEDLAEALAQQQIRQRKTMIELLSYLLKQVLEKLTQVHQVVLKKVATPQCIDLRSL